MIIDYGETYSSDTFQVRDTAGVLTNAGSVSCSLTLPDETTAAPTVVNDGPGLYSFDFTPAGSQIQAGLHRFVVTATGGVLGSLVRKWAGSYDVDNESALVSVREAVTHLRAGGVITSAADLEQVRWLCLVATDAVERDLGRAVTRRTVVEVHDGGRAALVLRVTPVVSITSVSESGTTLLAGEYLLDASAGILYRGSTMSRRYFGSGWQNITVTYIAGYVDPPRIARKVALNTVQGMWQSSQQAAHPFMDESAETVVSSVTGGLNPLEMRAYESLRAVGVA